jgi:glycine/D-amino acid oxidase-like deaminating enzyme
MTIKVTHEWYEVGVVAKTRPPRPTGPATGRVGYAAPTAAGEARGGAMKHLKMSPDRSAPTQQHPIIAEAREVAPDLARCVPGLCDRSKGVG